MSNLNSPVNEAKSPQNHPTNETNASFLRAARAGNLEKVLEYLKESIDINVSNSNGLNALHLASKEGHVHVVEELLKQNADVNAATKKGNTALHIASLAGQQAVVELLVQNGANVDCRSQNGFTPLYMAAQENHLEVVRYLLANNANQSLATEDGFTPLAVALQQGHEKVVALLLENDSRGKIRLPALHIAAKKNDVKAAALLLNNDPNMDLSPEAGKSGFTPLHIAAHYGNAEIAKFLITKGANVNYEARQNITPLHVATKWGKVNSVNLLLDNGAKIDVKTRDGLTPLHCAARSGHDQVVELLIARSAPINAKTKNGLTALHMAAQGDHVEAARILLYHSPKLVDQTTCDFLTALHVAAHCGHVKIAKLLIDHKADVNSRALNGFTPLHIACKKNRIKVIELLIKHGASKEATTESGLTPLHVASFMGCMNVVVFLIQHGAQPNVPTIRGETPLHLAARANQTDIVRILLRHGASVDAKAKEQQTPLHIATRLGNTDIIALLLRHGAFVDAATSDGYTPLHIASKEGQEEVASILFENGASLNVTTKKGFTPLHIASKYGNIKVASLLLQRDAQPDIQGKNGLTPLHVATHYNRPSVAHLLLQHNASPHIVAKNGYSALHIAAKKNQMDIATTLLEYNAKTNCESNAGFTPLHLACQEGHLDMACLLLDHQAEPGASSKNGLTPLHLCAQEDKVNCAAVLVKMGASIDPQTKAGYTPLHVACHFGQINMVKFLLSHMADVNIITKHGFTSLHCAAQQGHVLIVKLLLEHGASPDITNNNGQTPLAIAQRLGYISVIEELRQVTQTTLVSTTIKTTEEKYKVQTPETMQETFMSDSEDEMGDDAMFGDAEHYKYLTNEADLNNAADDSIALTPKTPKRDDSKLLQSPQTPSLNTESPLVQNEDHLANGHDCNQPESPLQPSPSSPPPPLPPSHSTQQNNNLLLGTSLGNMSMAESMDGSFYGNGYASSKNVHLLNETDNIPVEAKPKSTGFLISFMVDARGGAMKGCRHSGVRVIIPPKRASMPTRITCRFVRKEKLAVAPPLNESESLAARVLEMGPHGCKFLGPVVLEIPHYASLRGREREIVILRSDAGEKWYEHPIIASESAIEEALGQTLELLSSSQNHESDAISQQQNQQDDNMSQVSTSTRLRITRIITNDFPKYFALVSRVRHETHAVSESGGVISSTIVPKAQAVFPEKALQKKIKLSLQAMPIPYELVSKMFGNRVVVSPIVTIEPRRRKFHKAITLTIPLPKSPYKGMINNYAHNNDSYSLRLLCSITGGLAPAQWEDITGHTPLSYIDECVSFTTTVSARFWLMDCQNVAEATKMATELYREAIAVPFMARFIVYAKRHDINESKLRVYCITDDKEEKTLEQREGFLTVAKSKEVEVLDNRVQWLEMGGNIAPVSVNKSNSIGGASEQLNMTFMSFYENRLPFTIRIKDLDQNPPNGRLVFLKDSKNTLAKLDGASRSPPVCTLDIQLPPYNREKIQNDEQKKRTTLERGQFNLRNFLNDSSATLLSQASSTRFNNNNNGVVDFNLRLLANDLSNLTDNFDWINLAKALNLNEQDIEILKHSSSNSPNLLSASLANQTHDMLVYWSNKYTQDQTDSQTPYGNVLLNVLRQLAVDQDIIDRNSYSISNLPQSSENIYSVEKSLQNKFNIKDQQEMDERLDDIKNLVSHEDRDFTKESESAEVSENENEQYAVKKLPMNDQIELSNILNQIDQQIEQSNHDDESTQIVGEEHLTRNENGDYVTKTIIDTQYRDDNLQDVKQVDYRDKNDESLNEEATKSSDMDYASKINAEYEAIKRNILSRTGENEILSKTPNVKSSKVLDTVIDSQLASILPPLNQTQNLNSSYYDNLDHSESDLSRKYQAFEYEGVEEEKGDDDEESPLDKSHTSEALNDIIQQVMITQDQTEQLNKLDNDEFTWQNLVIGNTSTLASNFNNNDDDQNLSIKEIIEESDLNEQEEEVEQAVISNEEETFNIKLDRTQLREFEFSTHEFDVIQNIEQQSPIIERELLTTGQELENLKQRLAMSESVSAVTQSVLDSIRKEYNISETHENYKQGHEDEETQNKYASSELDSENEEDNFNLDQYKQDDNELLLERPITPEPSLELNEPESEQKLIDYNVQEMIENLTRESKSDLEKIIMIEPMQEEDDEQEENLDDQTDSELGDINDYDREDKNDENCLIESSSSDINSFVNNTNKVTQEVNETINDELYKTKQYQTFESSSSSSTHSDLGKKEKHQKSSDSSDQDDQGASAVKQDLIPTFHYSCGSTDEGERDEQQQEHEDVQSMKRSNLIIDIVTQSESSENLLENDHLQRDKSSYNLSQLTPTYDESVDDVSTATTVIQRRVSQHRQESSADISSEADETDDENNLTRRRPGQFQHKHDNNVQEVKSNLYLDIQVHQVNNSESTEPLIFDQTMHTDAVSQASSSVYSSSNYSLTTSDENLQKKLIDEDYNQSCSSLNSETTKHKSISKSLNYLESLVVPSSFEPEYTTHFEQEEYNQETIKLDSPIRTSQSLNFNPIRPTDIDLFPSSLIDEYSKGVYELEHQTPTPVENLVGSFFDKRISSSNEPSIDLIAQSSFEKDVEDDNVVDCLINQISIDPEHAEAEVAAALATAILFSSNVNSQSNDEIKSRNESDFSAEEVEEEEPEIRHATPSQVTRYIVVSGDSEKRFNGIDNQAFVDNDDLNSSHSSHDSVIINHEYDDTSDQQMMKIKIIQTSLPSKSLINTGIETIQDELVSSNSVDENLNDLQTVESLNDDYDQLNEAIETLTHNVTYHQGDEEFYMVEESEYNTGLSVLQTRDEQFQEEEKHESSFEVEHFETKEKESDEKEPLIVEEGEEEEEQETMVRKESNLLDESSSENEERFTEARIITEDKEPLIVEEDEEIQEESNEPLLDIDESKIEIQLNLVSDRSESESSFVSERIPIETVQSNENGSNENLLNDEFDPLITKDGVVLDDQSFLICTPSRSSDQTPHNDDDNEDRELDDDQEQLALYIVQNTLNRSIEQVNNETMESRQVETVHNEPEISQVKNIEFDEQGEIIVEKHLLHQIAEFKDDLEYALAESIVETTLNKSIEYLRSQNELNLVDETQQEFILEQNENEMNVNKLENFDSIHEKNKFGLEDTEPLIRDDQHLYETEYKRDDENFEWQTLVQQGVSQDNLQNTQEFQEHEQQQNDLKKEESNNLIDCEPLNEAIESLNDQIKQQQQQEENLNEKEEFFMIEQNELTYTGLSDLQTKEEIIFDENVETLDISSNKPQDEEDDLELRKEESTFEIENLEEKDPLISDEEEVIIKSEFNFERQVLDESIKEMSEVIEHHLEQKETLVFQNDYEKAQEVQDKIPITRSESQEEVIEKLDLIKTHLVFESKIEQNGEQENDNNLTNKNISQIVKEIIFTRSEQDEVEYELVVTTETFINEQINSDIHQETCEQIDQTLSDPDVNFSWNNLVEGKNSDFQLDQNDTIEPSSETTQVHGEEDSNTNQTKTIVVMNVDESEQIEADQSSQVELAKSIVSDALNKSIEKLNLEAHDQQQKTKNELINPIVLFELVASEPNSDQEFDNERECSNEIESKDKQEHQHEQEQSSIAFEIVDSVISKSIVKISSQVQEVEPLSIIKNNKVTNDCSSSPKEVRFSTINDSSDTESLLTSFDSETNQTQQQQQQNEQIIEFTSLQQIILNSNYEDTFNQMNRLHNQNLSEKSDSIESYNELEKIIEDKLEDETSEQVNDNDKINQVITKEAKIIIDYVIEKSVQSLIQSLQQDNNQDSTQSNHKKDDDDQDQEDQKDQEDESQQNDHDLRQNGSSNLPNSDSGSFEENLKSVDDKMDHTKQFCDLFDIDHSHKQLVQDHQVESISNKSIDSVNDIQNRIESTLESTNQLENYLNQHLDNILDEISNEQLKIDQNLNKELEMIKSQSSDIATFNEDESYLARPLLTSSFMSDILPSDSEGDACSFHTANTGLNESRQNFSSSNYLTGQDQDPSNQQLSASDSFYSAHSKIKSSMNSSAVSSYTTAPCNNSYNNLDESYSTLNDTNNNCSMDFDRTFVSENNEQQEKQKENFNVDSFIKNMDTLIDENESDLKNDHIEKEQEQEQEKEQEQEQEHSSQIKQETLSQVQKSVSSSNSSLASDKITPNTNSTNTNSSCSPLLAISKQINTGSGDNVSYTSSILEFEKLEAQCMDLNDDSSNSLQQQSELKDDDSFSYFEPASILTNDLNTIYEHEKESSSSSSPKLTNDLSIADFKSKLQSVSASTSPVQSPTGKKTLDHKGSTSSLTKQVLLQQSSRSSSSSSVKSTDSFETEFKHKVKIDENSYFAKIRQSTPPLIETCNENNESIPSQTRKKSNQSGSKRPSRTSSSASSTSSTSVFYENSSAKSTNSSITTVINVLGSNSNLKQQQSILSAEDLPSFKKSTLNEPVSKVPISVSASNIQNDLPKTLNQNLSHSASLSKEDKQKTSSHSHHSADCYCGKSSPNLNHKPNRNSPPCLSYTTTTTMDSSNLVGEHQVDASQLKNSPSSSSSSSS